MVKFSRVQLYKSGMCLCAAGLWAVASMANAGGGFEKAAVPEARAEEARNAVRAMLKDPESAQFRNIYSRGMGGKPIPNATVCGEVNAKNSYGGYIGFTRFYQSKPGERATLWSTEEWENSAFGFLCGDVGS